MKFLHHYEEEIWEFDGETYRRRTKELEEPTWSVDVSDKWGRKEWKRVETRTDVPSPETLEQERKKLWNS